MQSLISFLKKCMRTMPLADCLTKDMKCYRQGMKRNRQNWSSPLRHAGSSLRSMTRIQTGRRNFWHYYLNFIGKVELPAQELTEEELAEIKEKQRLRERNAMYQRRRRAKFMPKTKAIRAKVQEAEIKEALENASAKAEKLLMADNDTHIAEIVAGENKVYVDTGIFPTAEEVKEKYAI